MRRMCAGVLLCLLAMGLVAGCASPQYSRIDRNREQYESWPIEIQQLVLDGKVQVGMTPDMVRVSWGEPTKVVSNNPGEEIWVYETGGSEGTVLDPGISSTGGPAAGGAMTLPIGRGGAYPNTSLSGPSISGSGMGTTPIYIPPTPPDVKEVVFRNGVVFRADKGT
jgi:hypothetical protein